MTIALQREVAKKIWINTSDKELELVKVFKVFSSPI